MMLELFTLEELEQNIAERMRSLSTWQLSKRRAYYDKFTLGNHYIKMVFKKKDYCIAIVADLKFLGSPLSPPKGTFDDIQIIIFDPSQEVFYQDRTYQYWKNLDHNRCPQGSFQSTVFNETIYNPSPVKSLHGRPQSVDRPAWTKRVTWSEFMTVDINRIAEHLIF